jgi:GNAT superfamily N-acetyltransferase
MATQATALPSRTPKAPTPPPTPISSAQALESTGTHTIRRALPPDIPALQALIAHSMSTLGAGYYSAAALSGSIGYIFGVDTQLIADGTYFVLTAAGAPDVFLACGGWSYRRTLFGATTAPEQLRIPAVRDPEAERASIRAIFTAPEAARRGLGTMMMRYCEARAREGVEGVVAGFKGLEMGATLSGVALYARCGYLRSGRVDEVEGREGVGIKVVQMVKDLD